MRRVEVVVPVLVTVIVLAAVVWSVVTSTPLQASPASNDLDFKRPGMWHEEFEINIHTPPYIRHCVVAYTRQALAMQCF